MRDTEGELDVKIGGNGEEEKVVVFQCPATSAYLYVGKTTLSLDLYLALLGNLHGHSG